MVARPWPLCRLVDADRVTLFVVDDVQQKLICRVSRDGMVLELPIGKGIAGYVAQTGETVNITDAYSDGRFNQQVDKDTNYHTDTILCMPVIDKLRGGGAGVGGVDALHAPKVVAVLQCINSTAGVFSHEDESVLKEFGENLQVVLHRLQSAARLQTADEGTQQMLSHLWAVGTKTPALWSPKKAPGAAAVSKPRVKQLWQKMRTITHTIGMVRASAAAAATPCHTRTLD